MAIFGDVYEYNKNTYSLYRIHEATYKDEIQKYTAFVFLIVFFLTTTFLNPFIILHKLKKINSLANLLFVCICVCDFLINIWYPLYLAYHLIKPLKRDCANGTCTLYREHTNWDILNNTYCYLFKVLSEVFLAVLTRVRYRQIRYPLKYIDVSKVKVFVAVLTIIVTVAVISCITVKVTVFEAYFYRFSQTIECPNREKAVVYIELGLAAVEGIVVFSAICSSFASVYRLCRKREDEMEETRTQRRRGGTVIFIMSIAMVISYIAKNLQDFLGSRNTLETHYSARVWHLNFWCICVVPCFVGAFNSVSIVAFNKDIKSGIWKFLVNKRIRQEIEEW